jgi:hypothetical protein
MGRDPLSSPGRVDFGLAALRRSARIRGLFSGRSCLTPQFTWSIRSGSEREPLDRRRMLAVDHRYGERAELLDGLGCRCATGSALSACMAIAHRPKSPIAETMSPGRPARRRSAPRRSCPGRTRAMAAPIPRDPPKTMAALAPGRAAACRWSCGSRCRHGPSPRHRPVLALDPDL